MNVYTHRKCSTVFALALFAGTQEHTYACRQLIDIFRFAFPYYQNAPTGFLQSRNICLVSSEIALEFGVPETFS